MATLFFIVLKPVQLIISILALVSIWPDLIGLNLKYFLVPSLWCRNTSMDDHFSSRSHRWEWNWKCDWSISNSVVLKQTSASWLPCLLTLILDATQKLQSFQFAVNLQSGRERRLRILSQWVKMKHFKYSPFLNFKYDKFSIQLRWILTQYILRFCEPGNRKNRK